MAKLNSQQRDVCLWVRDGEGSANVLARAGCGKTYLLVRGVVRTIQYYKLGTVALTAYNKAAAKEFEDRLAALGSEFSNQHNVATGTVHSFGFRAWRRYIPTVKVDGDKVKNILRAFEQESISTIRALSAIKEEERSFDQKMELDEAERTLMVVSRAFASVRKLVSLAKQEGIGITSDINDPEPWVKLIVHHDIEIEKGNEYAVKMTAEDIVVVSQEALRASIEQDYEVVDFDDMIYAPLYHNVGMTQYDWVLVDEAQDTNATRRMLAKKMLAPNGRMIAVGDDRQAIYGFTGADSDALDIIKQEMGSIELPLTITYRCPKSVVAVANTIVPDLVADESAPEGKVWCITDPEWYGKVELSKNDAILSRTTAPLVDLAYTMLANGIACRIEGRDIAEGLIALATRWKRIKSLHELIDRIAEYKEDEIQKATERENAGKAQSVEDKCNAITVIANRLIARNKTHVNDLRDFIIRMFGDTPEGESPSVITLSTIHKAKGREWDRVFILNRAETIPSKWAKQEWQIRQEKNLEYVAITRAKRELIDVII